MARGNKHQEHASHERWLVSYADFITLLFAFFVVMFASSQTDKARAVQVSESVREALQTGGIAAAVREVLGGTVDEKGRGNAMLRGPGGSQPVAASPETASVAAELLPSLEYLSRELKAEIAAGKLQIRISPRGLIVSLQQAAFFPSGEDTVDRATYGSIEKIASVIRALPNPVRLEGHTDSVPIHNTRFSSNWELSAARAIAMLELLSGNYAIPRERLAIAGYADTAPVDSNDSEEGRARNRRVDVVILSKNAKLTEPALLPEGAPSSRNGHAVAAPPDPPGRPKRH